MLETFWQQLLATNGVAICVAATMSAMAIGWAHRYYHDCAYPLRLAAGMVAILVGIATYTALTGEWMVAAICGGGFVLAWVLASLSTIGSNPHGVAEIIGYTGHTLIALILIAMAGYGTANYTPLIVAVACTVGAGLATIICGPLDRAYDAMLLRRSKGN